MERAAKRSDPGRSLIDAAPLAYEFLKDSFYEQKIETCPEQSRKEICADELARRGRWLELARVGAKLGEADRFMVLRVLAQPPADKPEREQWPQELIERARSLRSPDSMEEAAFWSSCVDKNPLLAGDLLIRGGMEARYPLPVHDAFMVIVAAQTVPNARARPDLRSPTDFAKIVNYLAAFHRKEDAEVLARLLDHPGFVIARSAHSNATVRSYPVRTAALHALQSLGIKVTRPVIEEERAGVISE